jgi:2-oxoglutarate dehydrogenase E1 component
VYKRQLLRRQALRPYRKPLVIMSPKSLLRHPLVVSTLDDLAQGQFMPVLGEIDALDLKKVRRVIFCQGKVYYDLLAQRREQKITDIAILRLEQMYPFPDQEVKAALIGLDHVKDWVWCQEEPENQGAWFKVSQDFAALNLPCRYVGRKAYASPAVGYASLFKEEQTRLVHLALA